MQSSLWTILSVEKHMMIMFISAISLRHLAGMTSGPLDLASYQTHM